MVNSTPIQVPVHPPSPVEDKSDSAAFSLLVVRYQRRSRRLIARVVREVDLVEDIAQEIFIRAYRDLHQFQGESQFYTWLYRIVINTAKRRVLNATGQAPTCLCVSLFSEKGR